MTPVCLYRRHDAVFLRACPAIRGLPLKLEKGVIDYVDKKKVLFR